MQHKSGESAEFLAEYVKQWNQYTLYTFSVIKMFNYLDRYYLKNSQTDSQTLAQTALGKFKELIFKRRMSDLRWAILQEINKDR